MSVFDRGESKLPQCQRCQTTATAEVWGVKLCTGCYADWMQADWTSDGWMMNRLKVPPGTGMLTDENQERYRKEFERLTGLWAQKGKT